MKKPTLLIFASGTKTGGGSGFESLVVASKKGILDAEIVGVVSNYEHGNVRERAKRLNIPFIFFDAYKHGNGSEIVEISKQENESFEYRRIVAETGAEWVALSGWLKFVRGLDPQRTFNIHPALLSFDRGRFGGPGMYGHHIHEAVLKAFEEGEIKETGCSMHFVTEEFDRGPIFFEYRISLKKGMTAEDIQSSVQKIEHKWQPKITNMVIHEDIRWDGKDPKSLAVPEGYKYLPK